MTKYLIEIWWDQATRRWMWAVQTGDQMEAFSSAPFRWLAKRRAVNRLLDIKAGKEEAERKKALALKYEVEI